MSSPPSNARTVGQVYLGVPPDFPLSTVVITPRWREALQLKQVDDVLFVHADTLPGGSDAVSAHLCRVR